MSRQTIIDEQMMDAAKVDNELGFCAIPDIPQRQLEQVVSAAHEELIRNIEKKWVNGTELHYYYFRSGEYKGDEEQIAIVESAFERWRAVNIGIRFREVTSISESEIRIGFLRGDGSWSYVGRDVIDFPGQGERTMNFGWDLLADPRGIDTPVHEIGHTLGFSHEHQNPFSGIEWDEQAVLAHFRDRQGWAEDKTRHNVLRKLNSEEVEGGKWDPNSVMHYSFASGLIRKPEKFQSGLRPRGGLSREDLSRARRFYPPFGRASFPMLKTRESKPLRLVPAEQADFTIIPKETREYNIGTFGESDVVMVLFERHEDELLYLKGNDDSGTTRNAEIKVRLFKDREYVLRIRMYLNYGASESAVMMW